MALVAADLNTEVILVATVVLDIGSLFPQLLGFRSPPVPLWKELGVKQV